MRGSRSARSLQTTRVGARPERAGQYWQQAWRVPRPGPAAPAPPPPRARPCPAAAAAQRRGRRRAAQTRQRGGQHSWPRCPEPAISLSLPAGLEPPADRPAVLAALGLLGSHWWPGRGRLAKRRYWHKPAARAAPAVRSAELCSAAGAPAPLVQRRGGRQLALQHHVALHCRMLLRLQRRSSGDGKGGRQAPALPAGGHAAGFSAPASCCCCCCWSAPAEATALQLLILANAAAPEVASSGCRWIGDGFEAGSVWHRPTGPP